MTNLTSEALSWLERGYVPLPIRPDGSKAPAVSWRDYQTTAPDADEVRRLFARDTDGIGLLCGAVSGNLEMLELEGRAVKEGVLVKLITAFDDHGQRALWDTVAGGYGELTPSGGLHYYYRVDGPAARSTKLARRPSTFEELAEKPGQKVQVLIETRGEGGFTVIAPSAGRTHPTGKAWSVLVGSRDTIPTLTIEQRDALHAISSTLDESPAPTALWSSTTEEDSKGGRPGDDFIERGDWSFLEAAGWRRTTSMGGGRYGWVRPGKGLDQGISATTGGAEDGVDRLYVFSTSTEFEAEKPYDRFSALAVIEHGGDFAACASRLARDGYGTPPEEITLEGIIDKKGAVASNVVDMAPRRATASASLSEAPVASGEASDGSLALDVASAPTDITLARFGATEDGLAQALIAFHGDELRYVPQRDQWLCWDGHRWAWDEAGRHRELIKELARQLPNNDSWRTHRKKMLSSSGVTGVAKMACTTASVTVGAEKLDADPWVLNTPSGLVDLRSGAVTASSPDHLCTKMTGVAPQGGDAPRWDAFLRQTFRGDDEMIGYVQRLAGYSACGAQLEHVLPFLHGSGGNGKSVFLDVMVAILGDYASTTPSDFLLATSRPDESAIARLSGLRFVVCSEVNQNAKFDEAKVKLLTGGDRITARFLYGSHFTFVPTHHLWLMGNYQPKVEAGGESFWRRLRLVPFTHKVEDDKKVEGLAGQLVEAEGPQILAWLIAGAQDAITGKLRAPESVMAATRQYAEEEDDLARFKEDRIFLSRGSKVATADVRAAYAAWCRQEGATELSQQTFGRELRSRWGIDKARSHGKGFYVGMDLLRGADDAGDPQPGWAL